jgi:hypothetical protein
MDKAADRAAYHERMIFRRLFQIGYLEHLGLERRLIVTVGQQ